MEFDWGKDTQRSFADQYIRGAILEAGITSGDKYYYWLRDQGLPITREVARTAWKEYGTATKWADVLSVYNPNYTIPKAWYGETDAKGAGKYNYKLDVTVMDKITELPETKSWFIKSDKPLTMQGIVDAINDALNQYYPTQYTKVMDFTPTAIYHKMGEPW